MAEPADSLRKSLAPLAWVRPPQQQRSQQTFERILDAAEGFIVENGVQALTVSAVVARASSSVGAFYARFPDKGALLSTLHQRDCEAALATTDAALDPERWSGIELPQAIEQITRFCVRLFSERQKLLLGFLGLASEDVQFARRRAWVSDQVANRLHQFLLTRAEDVAHFDLKLAARMTVRLIFGSLEAEVGLRSATGSIEPIEDDRLALELSRAILGYLGVPVSSRLPRSASPLPQGVQP